MSVFVNNDLLLFQVNPLVGSRDVTPERLKNVEKINKILQSLIPLTLPFLPKKI